MTVAITPMLPRYAKSDTTILFATLAIMYPPDTAHLSTHTVRGIPAWRNRESCDAANPYPSTVPPRDVTRHKTSSLDVATFRMHDTACRRKFTAVASLSPWNSTTKALFEDVVALPPFSASELDPRGGRTESSSSAPCVWGLSSLKKRAGSSPTPLADFSEEMQWTRCGSDFMLLLRMSWPRAVVVAENLKRVRHPRFRILRRIFPCGEPSRDSGGLCGGTSGSIFFSISCSSLTSQSYSEFTSLNVKCGSCGGRPSPPAKGASSCLKAPGRIARVTTMKRKKGTRARKRTLERLVLIVGVAPTSRTNDKRLNAITI
mmetsp:Transcript_49941/g.67965  ORF Transcript_49941/g.67965 Transcript_49941/m.67965 type:complete len:317 (-) Transcript_49941:28-978(-)